MPWAELMMEMIPLDPDGTLRAQHHCGPRYPGEGVDSEESGANEPQLWEADHPRPGRSSRMLQGNIIPHATRFIVGICYKDTPFRN